MHGSAMLGAMPKDAIAAGVAGRVTYLTVRPSAESPCRWSDGARSIRTHGSRHGRTQTHCGASNPLDESPAGRCARGRVSVAHRIPEVPSQLPPVPGNAARTCCGFRNKNSPRPARTRPSTRAAPTRSPRFIPTSITAINPGVLKRLLSGTGRQTATACSSPRPAWSRRGLERTPDRCSRWARGR